MGVITAEPKCLRWRKRLGSLCPMVVAVAVVVGREGQILTLTWAEQILLAP